MEAFLAEILLLNLDKLVDVVLELEVSELVEVLIAENHVLNELSDLLVELDDIRLAVDELLNLFPIFKQWVVVGSLGATSETINGLAEDLTSENG